MLSQTKADKWYDIVRATTDKYIERNPHLFKNGLFIGSKEEYISFLDIFTALRPAFEASFKKEVENAIASATSIVVVYQYWHSNDRVYPYSTKVIKGSIPNNFPSFGNRDYTGKSIKDMNRGLAPHEHAYISIQTRMVFVDSVRVDSDTADIIIAQLTLLSNN